MGGLKDLMDDYIKPQVDFFALSSNNLVESSVVLCKFSHRAWTVFTDVSSVCLRCC